VNHRSQLQSEKRKPSEYMATNIYIGASFMAPLEVKDAVHNGYTRNVMWGREYGHIEGIFVVTDDDNPATNPGRMSMRYAFASAPTDEIGNMVGGNAIDFHKLNRTKLMNIAPQIGGTLAGRIEDAHQ